MKKYLLITQLITLFSGTLCASDGACVIDVLKHARNNAASKEDKEQVAHALDAAVRVVSKARRYDNEHKKNDDLGHEVSALREENKQLAAQVQQLEQRVKKQQQIHVDQLTRLEQYMSDQVTLRSDASDTSEPVHVQPAAA